MTEVAEPVDEPSDACNATAARPRSRLLRPTLAGATAFVALVAASVGVIFDFWPSWRPDPRVEMRADLDVIAVERNVTLGEWMRRSSGSPSVYRRRRGEYLRHAESSAGLRFRGELAYVNVGVRGFKRRGVVLNWAIYDVRTQERTAVAGTTQQGQQTFVRLDTPRDQFVAELWLEPVFGSRRYFVRVEARMPDGTLLAISDSKPFRGLANPY